MPEGSSQYVYLQSKRWRALGYNWDILSTYDNTSRLYCLTDFQVAWLLSNTEYMRWSSRWQNCPCSQADLDAMKAEMEYNLMSCIDIQPYQIQALYDGLTNSSLNSFLEAWDGSNPSSVNPSAPDDFFNGDGSSDRNDALCTAMAIWAYSYAVDWTQKASLILGVANVATQLLEIIIAVGGAIAVKVIEQLTAPLQATVDALNNQTALDNVICDWRDQLTGTAITPTNWSSGVAVPVYPVDSDESFIQQLFVADSQLLENFLSFVNSLGDAYELAQINVYICPCADVWQYDIDFTVDQGTADGWKSDGWTDGWFAGLGWQSEHAGINQELIYVKCDLPSPGQVTYYSFTYSSADATNFGTGGTRFLVGRYNDGTTTIETYRQNSAGLVINLERVMYNSAVPLDVVWLGCTNNPTLASGKWYLSAAEIRGVGSDPFI